MISVLLADDHTLVREGLCRLLERAGGIAVQARPARRRGAAPAGPAPLGLLVLDMSMPGRDGVDLIRQIRRDHPAVPILVRPCTANSNTPQASRPAPPAT